MLSIILYNRFCNWIFALRNQFIVMQINGIKNVRDLATDKFSISERGLMITLFILEEADPKLTLAKFKSQVKISEYENELITLQEKGFIKWSGYKNALKKREQSIENLDAIEAMSFFNNLIGTGHAYNAKGHYSLLCARLKEVGIDNVKLVISNRYAVWKDDSFMSKYLRPSTIFNASKFSIYFEEAKRTRVGESFLNVTKLGLNDGDVITYEIAQGFVDNDTYNYVDYRLDVDGNRFGSGRFNTNYGKDIKRTLKIQKDNLEYGHKEFEFVYKTK